MKLYITKKAKSPYRTDFYNELGKYVDLSIIYEYEIASGRNESWSKKQSENHNEIFLKGIRLFNGYSISLGFSKYLKEKCGLIIVGEYSTLTGALIILYLRLKRISFILNIDGGIIKRDYWIKFKIKKFLLSSATYWLSPSKSSDDYLLHYGAKRNRIYRYPFTSIWESDILSIPITYNEKEHIRNKLNLTTSGQIVLTVGQFIHRKGFDILLKAHQYNNDNVALIIIGGTPIREYLRIVKEYNLKNVYFIEFKVKSILADYFKAADLFVLPTREDIWGLVINEAMGYGLPIITTEKCVAGLELIENNINGYIVPNEDISELSKRMKQILNDHELRKEMSLANIKKIKKYTNESMAQKHLKILQEISNN